MVILNVNDIWMHMTSCHWLPPSLKPCVYCSALMRLGHNIRTYPSIVHNLRDILRHEGSVKMSDVNIMKQMRCISNPFFTSERLVGVNYERHLKRIFRFGQNLKKRTLSIGGRWDSMAIIIKTWERFGQKVADESQHSGNHYSWQFAGISRTCLSLCVFGGYRPHRLECHIEITRLCCQKFLLALLVHSTQEQLFFLPSYQSTHVKFDPNWDKWRRLTAGWRTEQCRQFKLWKVLWRQKHYRKWYRDYIK